MRSIIRLVLLLAVMASAVAPLLARPAFACTPVPSFNPVSDSDVVVAGRVTGWERTGAPPTTIGIPIRIRLAVDEVFRGSAESEIAIFDDSLRPDGRWIGADNCKPFNSDPTGSYVLMGLTRRPAGGYAGSIYARLSYGDEPSSAAYRDAVERLLRTGESALNLSEPRPCIPDFPSLTCSSDRHALWEGDALAWASEGINDADARLSATVAMRAVAGDQATLTALARATGQPYVTVRIVRYLAESRTYMGWTSRFPHEFVEIVNLGGGDQDLTGWTVQSPARRIVLPLPDGRVLRPGDFCRIARAEPRGPDCGVTVVDEDIWPDDTGRVLLVDAGGVVRADLLYSADPYAQPPPPNLEGIRRTP